MNDYISKPFTREVLLEVVAKWLQAAAATPISSNAESAMPSPTPPDWQFTTTGDKAGQQQHKRDTPTTSASASPAMGRPAPDAAAALTPPMARGASGRLNRPTAPTHLPIPSVATATAQQKLQKQPSQPPPSQKLQQQQQLLLPQSPLHYPPPAPLILSPTQARPPAATGTSTSSVFSDQPAGSQLPSTPASGQTSILRSPPTGMAPKAPAAHRLSRDMSSSGSLGSAGSGNRPRPPSTGALPVASMDVAAMLGQVLQSKPPPLPGVAKDVSKDVARTAPNRPDAPIGTTQSSEVPGSAASVAAAAATSSPKASSDKTAVAVLPPPTINLTSLFTSLPAPTTLPQPSNLPPAPPYTAALQSSSRVASLQRDAQRTPSPARPAPRSTPQDSSSTSHPLPRSPMMSHRPTPQRPARRSSPVFPAADSPRRQQTKRLPEPAALATAASKDDDASSERYV